ncbi:hypothetical protein COOONC_08782 [Cooperia oncophora]
MFILMISYTLSISALVKIPALNEWSGCKMETCLRNMYRTRNFFTVTVYAFTLVVFFSTGEPKNHANLCAGLLINQDQCFFQRNYPEMMRILAIVRCTLMLRIIVDPILSFATDLQIRRIFLTIIGLKQAMAYGSSRVFEKSSDGSGGEVGNGISRASRSQTASTIGSNLPSTVKL